MTLDQVKQAHEINQKLHSYFQDRLQKEHGQNGRVQIFPISWEIESETDDSITFNVKCSEYGPYQSYEESTYLLTLTKEELAYV